MYNARKISGADERRMMTVECKLERGRLYELRNRNRIPLELGPGVRIDESKVFDQEKSCLFASLVNSVCPRNLARLTIRRRALK